MTTALTLMVLQGCLGVWDTLYYHEWRFQLPARAATTWPELRLHAARDFVYAVLFISLPLVQWRGMLAWLLFALLAAEIAITLADFVVEDTVRKPYGGVAPGERVMHAIMAILYGGFLAYLVPEIWRWTSLPTGFAMAPSALQWQVVAGIGMGVGVFLSGLRDAWAGWSSGTTPKRALIPQA